LDNLGTVSCLGGDDEVRLPGEDLTESGVVVKAGVQKKQIPLLKALDEFWDELVFRGTGFIEYETQGSASNQIKQATKFDGNRA
jgi:hypothetical protein